MVKNYTVGIKITEIRIIDFKIAGSPLPENSPIIQMPDKNSLFKLWLELPTYLPEKYHSLSCVSVVLNTDISYKPITVSMHLLFRCL